MSKQVLNIPQGWKLATLGEICDIDPETLSSSTPGSYSFRYIDIASVSPNRISNQLSLEQFSSAPSRARKKVKANDVLMATVRPNLKAFAKVQETGEFVASTGFAVLRALDGKSHPEFLKQLIFSNAIEQQIDSLVAGSSYPAITVGNVKRLQVLAPTFLEQKSIAEVLSALDEQIEATECEIEKHRHILDGLIDRLLLSGERSSVLGDFAEIRPATKAPLHDSPVPFIPMEAVTEDGHLHPFGTRFWSEVSSGFTRFISGDVLVAKITPCFENGKGAQVPNGIAIGAGSTEFHTLRAKEGVNPRWIYWHTRAREFRVSGAGRMTGSAGQQRVPRDFIESFPVNAIPELAQTKAANCLDAIDDFIQASIQELEKLRLQKQGLMRDLLTGAVRVMESN